MVRPTGFAPNLEAQATNRFMAQGEADHSAIRALAMQEFEGAVAVLEEAGIRVGVVEHTGAAASLPDAVFPNNWFSTHPPEAEPPQGMDIPAKLCLYPMHDPSRRAERLPDAIAPVLGSLGFVEGDRFDLSSAESEGRAMEGTGSLVLDRVNRVAYACVSPRTDEGLVARWCGEMGYTPCCFEAVSADGTPVYHTNVVMSVGPTVALFAPGMVRGDSGAIIERLGAGGRLVIELTEAQIDRFAGNMLELRTTSGEPVLAASRSAWEALREEQRSAIDGRMSTAIAPIPTIERIGGGSLRCMIAEVYA